jgi:predicted protein tyrosine phosphatase
MMQLGDTNVYIGNRADSRLRHDDDWAVINTAKTVHLEIMGWQESQKGHPNYILFEDDNVLSFNWGDGQAFLYNMTGPEGFVRALDFIDRWIGTKKVLINCDQGQSRSPTVALLYLAKRLHALPDTTFAAARAEFVLLYPAYAPSGIADYVAQHWDEIH